MKYLIAIVVLLTGGTASATDFVFNSQQQVFDVQVSQRFALPQVALVLDVQPVSFGFNFGQRNVQRQFGVQRQCNSQLGCGVQRQFGGQRQFGRQLQRTINIQRSRNVQRSGFRFRN